MATFRILDYLSVGVIEGVERVRWEIYESKDMKKLIYYTDVYKKDVKTQEELFFLRVGLKKNDTEWYEESDNIFVRVKLYSKNAESQWYDVSPNKSHKYWIWINNDKIDSDDTVEDMPKIPIGLIETNRNGIEVNNFEDIAYTHKKQKQFRKEEYRTDY